MFYKMVARGKLRIAGMLMSPLMPADILYGGDCNTKEYRVPIAMTHPRETASVDKKSALFYAFKL
jgi:hypothetical protein